MLLGAWALPGVMGATWFVWPGLTPEFKEETFGIKPKSLEFQSNMATSGGNPITGKYSYDLSEIGETPTLL